METKVTIFIENESMCLFGGRIQRKNKVAAIFCIFMKLHCNHWYLVIVSLSPACIPKTMRKCHNDTVDGVLLRIKTRVLLNFAAWSCWMIYHHQMCCFTVDVDTYKCSELLFPPINITIQGRALMCTKRKLDSVLYNGI